LLETLKKQMKIDRKKSNKMNPNKSNMNNPIRTKKGVISLIALLFMMVFAHSSMFAQNSKASNINIYPLDSYVNSLKKNDDSATRLKNLVYEVQPSIYFYEGVVKNYGSNPKSLFTDVKGFNLLNKQDLSKNDIELITIRVENIQDFQNKIDLSNVGTFPKVKFIYILTTFNYDINSVPKVITNYSDSYVIIFKSDKGA